MPNAPLMKTAVVMYELKPLTRDSIGGGGVATPIVERHLPARQPRQVVALTASGAIRQLSEADRYLVKSRGSDQDTVGSDMESSIEVRETVAARSRGY